MERRPATAPALYTREGHRKYLTPFERQEFIGTARCHPRAKVATLCLVLAFTGCRISEALALTPASLNAEAGNVAIFTLKKRGAIVVREVPLPDWLICLLIEVHTPSDPNDGLWSWCRGQAWYLVCGAMKNAGIASGPHRTPRGLRHAFGVHALRCGVPIHLVQRWLGHASLATTAIYLQVMGPEEREFASRMWSD